MIRINLAPVVPRPRGVRLPPPALPGLICLAVLGSLVESSWTAIQEQKRVAQHLARASGELVSLKALVDREGPLRERVADLSRRAQALQALVHAENTTLRILDALIDAVPRDLRITTLEGQGLELRALGSAVSPTAVADLLSRLRASGKFIDVEIVLSKQDLGKGERALLTFEITCRFEG